MRNPPDAKDQPPHLRESNVPTRESTSSSLAALGGVERTSSPPSDAHALDRSSLSSSAPRKRAKRERASSPSVAQANALLGAATTLPRHTRKLRTPSPLPPSTTGDGVLDLSSDVALSIQGAYPQGCVLWVRNVHEKSSKTSLKSLFGKLLDDLQEGSGKGVEFVDYEKGLETVRLPPPPLSLRLGATRTTDRIPKRISATSDSPRRPSRLSRRTTFSRRSRTISRNKRCLPSIRCRRLN